jgi:Amt family ammonium transporter
MMQLDQREEYMENLKTGSDTLFILLGAIMVLAMHAGFAFLELGTVRKKNQVNALMKILVDFSISTIAYFFIGYSIAYGVDFFSSTEVLAQKNGFELVKFFFLLTFAAAIPAIISGGIAERAKFNPQLIATFIWVGFLYPFFEGIAWNQHYGIQAWIKEFTGEEFHDFAGSVVVHAVGGWIALPAIILLGARRGRYNKDGQISAHPPSSIPFLALGAWTLAVGWFGFNVMSAQTIDKVSGLVAMNSLMAMVGGTLAAWVVGKNDPGFTYNGPLAGLVAVCAGSDLMHPLGALFVGLFAGGLFVYMFTLAQKPMDRGFIVLLLMISVTGLGLLALRETQYMGILLALHLGFVMGFFLMMPYGKFAHGIYRSAALLKNAVEVRLGKKMSVGSE